MKIFLAALSAFVVLQAHANYQVQKFNGSVSIKTDIAITFPGGDALDVLFVMDNSGSMSSHQKALSSGAAIIDQALSSYQRDFHLGVISMDVMNSGGGQLVGTPKVITSKDMPGALAKSLNLGVFGSSQEAPFEAIKLALSEPNLSGTNRDFLRFHAQLAIVLITDAEDQSRISDKDLQDHLYSLKRDMSKVTMFSWIVPSTSKPDCDRDTFTDGLPVRIEELTKNLNGVVYNICEMNTHTITDFAQKLALFGGNTFPAPFADIWEIPLKFAPVLSTVEVRYGTQILTGGDKNAGWIYDSATKSILLGGSIPWSRQPVGTKLEVSFETAE